MREALQRLYTRLSTEAEIHGDLIPLEPHKGFAQNIMHLVVPDHPVRQISSLDSLRSYVDSSALTAIDSQRTHAVFGEGNPDADIMLVGEAPGAEEDRTGLPFVGRAGQLLDKMMAAINLTREDLFIANILKTRPPENRDPTADEIAAHLPVLYRQMHFIQPKFILCLGRIAVQTLLETKASLGSLRGQAMTYHGAILIATYHPAALLRNPTWKRPAWEDLQLLQRLCQTQ